MKYILFLFMTCCVAISGFAQKNFVKGLVVNGSGDTLRGLINYREFAKTPDYFEFKSNENAEAKRLTVKDVQFVAIIGAEELQRFVVKISMDENDRTKFDPNVKVLPPVTDTLFLEVVERGKYSLFAYRDELKTRYFLSTDNSNPEELVYRITVRRDDKLVASNHPDGLSIGLFYGYRNELANVAKKENKYDHKLEGFIKVADYKRDKLANIVRRINGTENTKKINMTDNTRATLYVGAGVMYATHKFGGTFPGIPTLTNQPNSSYAYTPTVTLGTDVYLKPSVGTIFLRVDASNFSLHEKTNDKTYSSFRDYNYDYTFKVDGVRIGAGVMYHVLRSKAVHVYLGATYNGMFSYKLTSVVDETSYFHNTQTVESHRVYNHPIDTDKTWYYVTLQTGVRVGENFDVTFSYMPKMSVARVIEKLSTKATGVSLSVNYKLLGKHKIKS